MSVFQVLCKCAAFVNLLVNCKKSVRLPFNRIIGAQVCDVLMLFLLKVVAKRSSYVKL